MPYASRAGLKLEAALKTFKSEFDLDIKDKICADLGCSTGGFTDCLLQNGAKKVYAVDTAYGELAWNLRNDPRVVVLERVNAIHLNESDTLNKIEIHQNINKYIPEKIDIVTIDVAWTPQKLILPAAIRILKDDGYIISLIKPHYEAEKGQLYKGVVKPEFLDEILNKTKKDITDLGLKILDIIESPIEGKSGGNKEYLALTKIPK